MVAGDGKAKREILQRAAEGKDIETGSKEESKQTARVEERGFQARRFKLGSPGGGPVSTETLLHQFSEQFSRAFRGVVDPAGRAIKTLSESPESDLNEVSSLLPSLRELHHQVQELMERVAQQQAYVLIFGPLKSGKSTFMNALGSAYVSEVTSLPAYPCLVHVTYSETPEFTVTQYDGTKKTLTSHQAIRDLVEKAHPQLVERIREVEASGEDFEPSVHMPEAIRNIEAKIPVAELAKSRAVLVDTPGLYSRMKFGYDRMTRDFRDGAACAIFVVKTDNLFLEQVFDEFQELLDLFSKVFLVVNVDTNKKDLRPDGSFVPSLECEDPQRIIDAFRNLSMSAPLKAAADEGRLEIYSADLLDGAARRIRKERGETVEDSRGKGGKEGSGMDFNRLLNDLVEYLNSNSYIRAFLFDSLRRADSLLEDLRRLTNHEAVHGLRREASELGKKHKQAASQAEALRRLSSVEWGQHSEKTKNAVQNSIGERAAEVRRTATNELNKAITGWFEDDSSLSQLNSSKLDPLLKKVRSKLVEELRSQVLMRFQGTAGGLELPEKILEDLGTAEIDMDELARTAGESVRSYGLLPELSAGIACRDIPVRRCIWDWLLLRRKAVVRKRLFGPPENPDRKIPPAAKARRLDKTASEEIRRLVVDRMLTLLGKAVDWLPFKVVEEYLELLSKSFKETLARKREETESRVKALKGREEEIKKILNALEKVGQTVESTSSSMKSVHAKFGAKSQRAEQLSRTDKEGSASGKDTESGVSASKHDS